jgi:hypothetical protein
MSFFLLASFKGMIFYALKNATAQGKEERIHMKRYWVMALSFLMIGSLLTACATAVPEHQRGAYTKRGMPRQAQEQVVPEAGTSQSAQPQNQDEAAPKDSAPTSK